MPTRISRQPPIVYGAALLSVLSLFWSAYAITDLMQSGRFGLSVALAGDIGWITVLGSSPVESSSEWRSRAPW